MSWGSYWMYYDCPRCGYKYRWPLEEMSNPRFGLCPICDLAAPLVAETKDIKPGEERRYDQYVAV